MGSDIGKLEPAGVWKYFLEICKIPRASKKEEKIIAYILNFAKEHNLPAKKDSAGNILIKKHAMPGMEDKPTVVLQSHLDMVCEKNESTEHNFDTDSIIPFIDDGWIKARGTTLGGDDGIGIAAQLALLASDSVKHGTIECLFTVDEETGLTGAFNLEPGLFEGKILLNLDSEDEGIIFIGCAGGIDTTGVFHVESIPVAKNFDFYRIEVRGLQGGHSGDDINKGLGNSIKIINRVLRYLQNELYFELINIEGGNLRNAIARESFAEIAIIPRDKNLFENSLEKISESIIRELHFVENKLVIKRMAIQPKITCLSKDFAQNLINLIYSLPHGVEGMSKSIPGMVETSTNLASVKRKDENTFVIATSQRSSINSLKKDISQKVKSVFILSGSVVEQSTGYPGWKPNKSSKILEISEKTYIQLFNKQPVITAIHAGLECGLFLEKYPYLDMISFGPTIKGAHSPDERLEIESVVKFWNFLVEVLKNIE